MPQSDSSRRRHTLDDLLGIMQKLRDPESGCPWDVEQDFTTIAPYTVEEAYEVADAIDRADYADLCQELGDLLFQVVFHAQMAREAGSFAFDDVVQAICDKLIRRHPHVFAGQVVAKEDLSDQWERFKQQERSNKSNTESLLADIPSALPALTRASKLQKRAAKAGFDWPDIQPVLDKIDEELQELQDELNPPVVHERVEMELGDLLFSCVNLARHLKIDPEWSLRKANQRFEARFGYIEQQLKQRQRRIEDATLDELDALWEQAKGHFSSSDALS